MKRNRRVLRAALSGLILLAVGCAANPAVRDTARTVLPASNGATSPVFASIDEAAVAGLIAARQSTTRATRAAIRIGTIREVAGGYVWTAPVLADVSVLDRRPFVLRLSLRPDDIATFVVHPQTGASYMDRINEKLNASEKRLLSSRSGRKRPLYLLTPRFEVVRHAIDEPVVRMANLRALERALGEGSQTAKVD
jgi:hypothetical protein